MQVTISAARTTCSSPNSRSVIRDPAVGSRWMSPVPLLPTSDGELVDALVVAGNTTLAP